MPVTANIKMGSNCYISPDSFIGFKEHGGQITLGNHVSILNNCIIRTCTGIITIGDYVSVGYGTIMHGLGGIKIGSGTLISPRVQIYAQNHGIARKLPIRNQKQTSKGVIIGSECWIGASAIILDGVNMGEGSVVGAGSIVAKNIGSYEIWAGNPAKKIGERK